MTLSDAAPAQITCTTCLAKLINPGAMTGGAARAVLPVEVETSRDTWTAKLGIAGLVALLVFGSLIGIVRRGSVAMAEPALQAVVLGVVGVLIWSGTRMVRARTLMNEAPDALDTSEPASASVNRQVLPPLPPMAGGVLDYQDREHFRKQRFSVGAFIGGFFAALGVCAAGILSLAFTYDPVPKPLHPLIVGGLLVGVGAFVFFSATIGKRRAGWRGFGRGSTIGLVLGMLALGPCALCYMAI